MHTRTSILASMPSSVVDRMRSLKSDVPEPIMEAAGDDAVKQYLLKQASISDQQKIIIGEWADLLLTEARITNGRLNTMEPKVERHQRYVDDAESRVSNRNWDMKYLWIPVLLVGMQAVLKKLGWL